LIVTPENPNSKVTEETIVGETFIRPKKEYEFSYNGLIEHEWIVDKKYPVVVKANGKKAIIKWDSPYSG